MMFFRSPKTEISKKKGLRLAVFLKLTKIQAFQKKIEDFFRSSSSLKGKPGRRTAQGARRPRG